MKYYKIHKFILISISIIFVIMGIVSEVLSVKYDKKYHNTFFPFFSWALFEKVPNRFNDYGVIIVSIDGEEMDGIKYFQDLNLVFKRAKSADAYRTIQKMGNTLSRKKLHEYNKYRQLFESYYLGDANSVKYRIVKRSHVPLSNSYSYKITNDLGEFDTTNISY